jgi:hypothetical protein
VGCWVAILLVLAAAILWIVKPPMQPDLLGFCRQPIDAIYTIWDKSWLRAPMDERCVVRVGPRTVAVAIALIGLIALAILAVPAWLTRRRSAT